MHEIDDVTSLGDFGELQRSRPLFRSFETPCRLITYLTRRDGDLDYKDRLYGSLVTVWQCDGRLRQSSLRFLVLGLWPGLSGIYRRRAISRRGEEAEEAAADILAVLAATAARIDLAGVRRLAATLVRNVDRDTRKHLQRQTYRRDYIDELDDEAFVLDVRAPRIDDRRLPVDAGDENALYRWIESIVGDDAPLVVGAAIYGYDQRELANTLGMSHDAARKRYQRATERLRRHLGK